MKSPGKYEILIAEDSFILQLILKKIFSKLDYGYTIVENGSAVLKELTQKKYDLILMDYDMPIMDGITATRKIREDCGETGKVIPIIAMSGHADSDTQMEFLKAGMNDYIVKPFKTEVLQEKIQTHLEAFNNAEKRQEKTGATTPESSQRIYDLTYLNEFVEGDSGFLQKLIHYFIETGPEMLDSMKNAVRKKQWEELSQIAHKFSSELAFLGMKQLKNDIYDLEQQAKNPTDQNRIQELAQNIESVCLKIIEQLKIDFPVSDTKQATILLCEDNFMLSKTIEFKLKKDGYIILTAEDGKVATEILKKEKVDLIITDLLMPYIGGLELIVLARKELNLTLPIMVLSGIGLEKTVIQAFELGANDYLVKPFSPLELSLRVKKLLS